MLSNKVFLISCQSSASEKEAPGKELAAEGFVANPQLVAKQEVSTLAIGAEAPDFNLPGTDGKFYTLDDFSDAAILRTLSLKFKRKTYFLGLK